MSINRGRKLLRLRRTLRQGRRNMNRAYRRQGRCRFYMPYRNHAFELKYYERQPPFRGS